MSINYILGDFQHLKGIVSSTTTRQGLHSRGNIKVDVVVYFLGSCNFFTLHHLHAPFDIEGTDLYVCIVLNL